MKRQPIYIIRVRYEEDRGIYSDEWRHGLMPTDRILVAYELEAAARRLRRSLRYALPNVNGGERPPTYKGVLKENEAP